MSGNPVKLAPAVASSSSLVAVRDRLYDTCHTPQTEALGQTLARRILGQERVVEAVTCAFARVQAGLRDCGRPALTLLLLGPTGVGKTETARALAQALFGSDRALTRIDCEEYAHGHEVAKLLGAPPGYVGYGTEPLLSQSRINAHGTRARSTGSGLAGSGERFASDGPPLSLVLFDEIEKAHPTVWNAMLGILEEGRLTLGNNQTTNFTNAIIVMTSNAGSREVGALAERREIGFRPTSPAAAGAEPPAVEQAALEAARLVFPPEFLNRFDQVLTFQPLQRRHLEQVFQKFLAEIHTRALEQARVPLMLRVSREARDLIIDRGTDPALGARPLRRAVEAALVDPLSRLIGGHRIEPGDVIEVERDGDELAFFRTRDRSALVS